MKLPELRKTKVNESLPWPKTVKVLTASDFIEGQLEKGGKACLLGHYLREVGGPLRRGSDREKVYKAMVRRTVGYLNKMKGSYSGSYSGPFSGDRQVAHFNDVKATRAFRAKLFNRVMADFGYTEGNPEA